jgi:hypothetical protein
MTLSLKVEEIIFFKFQPLKFTERICAADLEASWSSINQWKTFVLEISVCYNKMDPLVPKLVSIQVVDVSLMFWICRFWNDSCYYRKVLVFHSKDMKGKNLECQ